MRRFAPASKPICDKRKPRKRLRLPPTPPAAGLADEVRGALLAITGAGVVVKKVLQVLGKILGNIAREPQEIKFRVLKLANKTVAEHLVQGQVDDVRQRVRFGDVKPPAVVDLVL